MSSFRLWVAIVWLLTSFLPLNSQVSKLKDLNVVMLGDSNTWLGGDDCTGPRGWNTWFAREVKPLSCHSYARSGATWTNTPQTKRNTTENIAVLGDDNVVYNQICRLTEAVNAGTQPTPHIIIIMAGTNDAWFHDKRPQAFEEGCTFSAAHGTTVRADSTVTNPNEVLTLAGAVRYGCRMLKQEFPDAEVVLVTPMQSVAVADSLITVASDIIEAAGKEMGTAVLRLDRNGCVVSAIERQEKRFTYDGTHTNEAGAQCIARLIAGIIMRTNSQK